VNPSECFLASFCVGFGGINYNRESDFAGYVLGGAQTEYKKVSKEEYEKNMSTSSD
jgi:hypothetical protein